MYDDIQFQAYLKLPKTKKCIQLPREANLNFFVWLLSSIIYLFSFLKPVNAFNTHSNNKESKLEHILFLALGFLLCFCFSLSSFLKASSQTIKL